MIDYEEFQVDSSAVAVFVADVGYAAADGGGDSELFFELAGEGLLGGFAGLDLAAGELPFKAHRLVGAALAHEDFGEEFIGRVIPQDQGSDDQPDRLGLSRVGGRVELADGLFHLSLILDGGCWVKASTGELLWGRIGKNNSDIGPL